MLEVVDNMIDFTCKIGGPAGFGIKTTGDMFSKTCMRAGFNIFSYIEYPSLIRGGHNVVDVRVSKKQVFSQKKTIDILVALNRETVDLHKDELADNALIIYDADQFKVDGSYKAKDVRLVHVPLLALVKKAGGEKVMENNVALGASLAIIGMDLNILFKVIEDRFGRKGEEIVKENQDAAKAGYKHIEQNYNNMAHQGVPLQTKRQQGSRLQNGRDKILVTGNDAVALGAIAGGCKLYCAYPMTPASSILHTLAAFGEKVAMVVRHAEDEIAVVNLACGAGFAGVRVMIGTSGGGLSLMVEGLGLVGLTESPLVVVDSQRPGPATGMPTWTGQGDLRFILHAHQDDFPRIVLAPGDVREAFELTWRAFNFAEKYQTAVFILLDKYLSESHKSTKISASQVKIDRGKLILEDQGNQGDREQYLRYKVTDDGIPPRAIPGLKNTLFTANSYEHNEYGLSSEDPNNRNAQVGRRNRKLDTFRKDDLPEPVVYGERQADVTLVGWGSTKGPALQAIHEMEDDKNGIKANYLHLNYLWPFPAESVEQTLKRAKKTLLLEGNHASELRGLIRQETGIEIKDKYLKYDGRPFYPEDIIEQINHLTI